MNNKPNNESDAPGVLPEPPALPFLLVGLGASAGGIQALQTYFDNMPPDSGMAFVVIMHLSPDHESNLAQILQNRTAMPVVQVTEPTKVVPDHVYVIPPSKHLRLEDGHIHLVEPQQAAGKRIAIDLLFRTLASAYGPRAVAIVLSGSDGDGSIGIKHVKEQGGLTIAQDPDEAEFDSMPRSAIATGMVDWVLPVGQMPPQLMEFLHNEARLHIPPEEAQSEEDVQAEDQNSGGSPAIREEPSAEDEEALLGTLHFLRAQTGHDFTHYKRATILRRVARRMQVNLLEDIPSYLQFLNDHVEETRVLLHDLLISVTNFFRDADAFAALQTYIPQLFADKKASDQVRVWVAGCATGEEAYSVAMLLLEYAGKLDTPPAIQVFATDLDEDAIVVARAGRYPYIIEADVSPERLRRFFLKVEGGYCVKKELRERVLFSLHNLLKDSPFSRLDLVTCRNLLIYLKRDAQESIFDLFHFALRSGGMLLLGSAEGIADSHALFAPLDRKHRLFVRRAGVRAGWQLPAVPFLPQTSGPKTPSSSLLSPAEGGNLANWPHAPSSTAERSVSSYGELHVSALEQFAPPSLLVNAQYDILHLSEHASRFLQMAGEPSRNLLQIVHPALRVDLRTALFQALQQHSNVTTAHIPFEETETRFVTLHVRPVRSTDTRQELLLVVFEPTYEPAEAPFSMPATPDAFTRHLQEENQQLRSHLNAAGEQHEASLEELKSSHEEQQSINEEMRSAAEELETSKEELQSTNEELTTVNQELKINVDELSRANGDLQNLMASTEIGTIFLDRQLRIKRYTPRIRELFNIIPTDVGRPLSDITHKLNDHVFAEDAERVLADLSRSEREVRNNGNYFLARMLPYRTPNDYIDGVVLTFIDITERKKAEEALREAEMRMRLIMESAHDYAIFTTDLERRVTSWNSGAQALFRYADEEILGRLGDILFTPEDREASAPLREAEKAQTTGRAENERWHSRKDGSRFYGSGMVTPLRDDAGNHIGSVKVMRDLTEQKQAEEALAASEEKYRSLFASIDEGFCIVEMIHDAAGQTVDYRLLEVNQVFERQTGLVNAVGKRGSEIDSALEPYWLANYDNVTRTGEPARFENYHEITGHWYSTYVSRVGGVGSRQVAIVFDDITERKRTEQRQAFLLKLSDAIGSLPNAVEITETVTRTAMDYFKADRCYYCEIEGDVLTIRRDARHESLPSVANVYSLSEMPLFKAVTQSGQTIIVGDVHTSDMMDNSIRQLCLSAGIVSYINVPVMKDSRLVGNLCLAQSTARDWTAQDIAILEETAERTWAAVERARAETALRLSEERLQVAQRSGGIGVWDWNAVTGKIYWSDTMYALYGCEPQADGVTQEFFFSRLHPDDKTGVEETVLKMAETGSTDYRDEFRIILPNGSLRWIESMAHVTYNEGTMIRASGVNLDITERKQHELDLALLTELGTDFSRVSSAEEIMYLVGTKLAAHLGISRCVFAEVFYTEDRVIVETSWCVPGERSIAGTYRLAEYVTPDLTDTMRNGGTIIIHDTQTDSRTNAEAYAALNIGADIVVPFHRNGEWKFLLTVTTPHAREWQAHEIALVQEVTSRTFPRIERARAEAALQARQKEIEDLNVRLQRAMAETHHRVKNNLQVIVALVAIQSAELDVAGAEVLRRINHHIRSLALIHDLLTQQAKTNGNMDKLGMDAMMGKLLPLMISVSGNRAITAECADIPLPPEKAGSLAMLINECVSNAVKHSKSGTIEIILRHNGEKAVLTICDQGDGFPDGFDPQKAANTGFSLIESAAKWDLGGTLAFDNHEGGGGRVTIVFPIASPSSPAPH